MKCSFGISNFLEEISSISYSVVFLYFFAWINEQGFLISPCYSLELCIQMVILSFSPLLFASLIFTVICKASSDSHFDLLHFFILGMVLIPVSCTMSWTYVHSSSGTLSIKSSPLNPFLTSTVKSEGILFRSYLNGLVVIFTFFNFSLNLTIRCSWSEPQSAPSLVFTDCIELLHLWMQRIQSVWFWCRPSVEVHV